MMLGCWNLRKMLYSIGTRPKLLHGTQQSSNTLFLRIDLLTTYTQKRKQTKTRSTDIGAVPVFRIRARFFIAPAPRNYTSLLHYFEQYLSNRT